MAEYLSPGVFVEEFNDDRNVIEGVGTSTAGFVGLATRGPVTGKPVRIQSPTDFGYQFGRYLDISVKYRYLAYGVEQFFANGGSSCYVMRVASSQDTVAAMELAHEGIRLHMEAGSVGEWGNEIRISLEKQQLFKTNILEEARDEKQQIFRVKSSSGFEAGDLVELVSSEGNEYNRIVRVLDGALELEHAFTIPYVDNTPVPSISLHRIGFDLLAKCDDIKEAYRITLNPAAADFVNRVTANGILLHASFSAEDEAENGLSAWMAKFHLDNTAYTGFLKDGKTFPAEDAALFLGEDNGPGKRSGLHAFKEIDDVSIMAMPGVTVPEIQRALIAHCETMENRFAILDMPQDTHTSDEMLRHRSYFDSSYAAIYHPWLNMFDSVKKKNCYFPPSASVAGVYARVDCSRGVHKAPANEVLRQCVGLSVDYNEGTQSTVSPKGINLIRSLPGQGIRVWGARTMSSDSPWKYINVRRLLIYVKESIRAATSWVSFEPNDANLWARADRTIRMFLDTLWRNGALAGSSADEAFFINIGPSTMTQDDILNGRLICEIGIAPIRPAEFEMFQITHNTNEHL
ncbi:MAG: phage tail sheath subtilisin-like domain-containing protein [Lachnospiraceae bacterium]|nr:phage tail sheath subtilisin-like domain-containing protein [Lachnospiraceae bacterium]